MYMFGGFLVDFVSMIRRISGEFDFWWILFMYMCGGFLSLEQA